MLLNVTFQSDVVGNCYTDYTVASVGWSSTSIKKVKDILGCTDRHGYQSSVHATPYRVPSVSRSNISPVFHYATTYTFGYHCCKGIDISSYKY